MTDIGPILPGAAEIRVVLANGLMDLDQGRFRPDSAVTRGEVADTLARARAGREACTAVGLPAPAKTRNADRARDAEAPAPIASRRATRSLSLSSIS